MSCIDYPTGTTVAADAVATMSRYVQFDTTNPPGNEMAAAQWLRGPDRGPGHHPGRHNPRAGARPGLVVARIPGSEPLKPLIVNHHMDVVAANPTQWTQPPFSGAVADGFVWDGARWITRGWASSISWPWTRCSRRASDSVARRLPGRSGRGDGRRPGHALAGGAPRTGAGSRMGLG